MLLSLIILSLRTTVEHRINDGVRAVEYNRNVRTPDSVAESMDFKGKEVGTPFNLGNDPTVIRRCFGDVVDHHRTWLANFIDDLNEVVLSIAPRNQAEIDALVVKFGLQTKLPLKSATPSLAHDANAKVSWQFCMQL